MPAQRSPIVRKKKVVKRPSATQRARAQEQQYESQGRAVEKRANEQKRESGRTRPAPAKQPGPVSGSERKTVRRVHRSPEHAAARQEARKHGPATRRGTKRPGGDDKSAADRQRAQDYVREQYRKEYGKDFNDVYEPGTTIPPGKTAMRRAINRKLDEEGARKAESPVVKVLEQTTRPLHALAGAEREIIKGLKAGKVDPAKVGKSFVKGAKNEEKSTFSDVLGDLGVKNKAVKSVGGFVGDVFGDPTTYITGGAASVAKKAAADAAKQTAKKTSKIKRTTPDRPATKKEQNRAASREQGGGASAPTLADRAADRAERQAPEGRGLSIRFAGREAPGVRNATAKAGRGVRKVTDKPKVVRKVKDVGRRVAADVNPAVTPDNLARGQFREVRRAARTARSTTTAEVKRAKDRGAAFRKAIGKADQEILDAIESGTVKKLSPEKRHIAKRYSDELKYARRVERRAGIPVKDRKNYVPHVVKDPAKEGKGVGNKTIKPSFSKGRKEQRTLAEIRKTDPGKYVENAPALLANRLVESGVARTKADLNRRLAEIGTRIKKGQEINPDTLRDKGEAVFHIKGSNVRELNLKNSEEVREIQRFIDGDSSKGGQYVVLNQQAADRALKGIQPQLDRSTIGKIVDKGQGGWKWLATVPNPGFHVRNFAGGIQNAYLYAPGHKLPLNLTQAAKVLTAHGRSAEATRKLSGKAKTGGTINTKRYGNVTLDEVAKRLEKAGAIRSGQVGREVPELLEDATKPVKIRKGTGKAGRSLARAPRNIEDLPRAATAIEALKRGATWEQAAETAAKFHFDYGDLTRVERRYLRRLMPFYTFSARNIPLQIKSYIQKPGKFANYQKVREEMAKAFGVDLDAAELGMEEHEARAAPIVIKHKGHELNLSLGPSGLPMTDLNEMPTSAKPDEWADEWISRGMSLVTPIVKSPVEYWSNFSFFFRDQIERETGPLVPAPLPVTLLPKPLRDKLGVVDDYVDRRTGKKGWGWPAKADYIASQLTPGPLGAAKRITTPSERQGQDTGSKALSYAGLRATRLDKVTKQINDLYEERQNLGKKRAALNQRGMNAENRTPEWSKVNGRYNEIDDEIAALRAQRGDKLIPKRGRPKSKTTVRKRPSSSSGSSGFFGGSSSSSSSSSSGGSSGGFFD